MRDIIKKLIRFIGWNFFETYFIKKRFNLIEEYKKDTLRESYLYFKDEMNKSILFRTSKKFNSTYSIDLFEFSINKIGSDIMKTGLYLEFGTFKGNSAKIISNIINNINQDLKLFTFDSFDGLSEDWIGSEKAAGTFKLSEIPKLPKNCEIIKGNIYETLKPFLKKHNLKISFIHCDVDTYEITKFILEECKNFLNNKSIIIFDDLHNRAGWKNGQIKALEESFDKNNYKYIAFSESGQATILIEK